MLLITINFNYASNWINVNSFILRTIYYFFLNSFRKYTYISYLSLHSEFRKRVNLDLFVYHWSTFYNHLFSTSYDQVINNAFKDRFLSYEFESSSHVYNVDDNDDIVYMFDYVFNFYIIYFLKSEIIFINRNIFFLPIEIHEIDHNLSITTQHYSLSKDHSLINTLKYNFVDNYKFFSFDEISSLDIFFSGVKLNRFFCNRYGIGSFISTYICKYLGLSRTLKLELLANYAHYSVGSLFFESKSKFLDSRLAEYYHLRHLRLIKLNSRKGIRLLNGYPIHGQRTRSNSKTASKYPYKLKFKKLI